MIYRESAVTNVTNNYEILSSREFWLKQNNLTDLGNKVIDKNNNVISTKFYNQKHYEELMFEEFRLWVTRNK